MVMTRSGPCFVAVRELSRSLDRFRSPIQPGARPPRRVSHGLTGVGSTHAGFLLLLLMLPAPARAEPPHRLLPNLDDDDRDGRPDGAQACGARGDDDLAPLRFTAEVRGLRLDPDSRDLRVCRGERALLGPGSSAAAAHVYAGEVLHVEALSPWARGALTAQGWRYPLASASVVLPSPLAPTDRVYVARPRPEDPGELAFVDGLFDSLSDRLHPVRGLPDQWAQDQVEFVRLEGAGAPTTLALIAPEAQGMWEELEADEDALLWDGLDFAQFGDLSATPPVEAVGWPRGAVLTSQRGDDPGREALVALIRQHGVQPVVRLPTSWLAVGHVDEIVGFVPDETSRLGFRVVIPDPLAGLALLDSLPVRHRLDRYRGGTTAGALRTDSRLRRYNERLATGPLRRLRDQLQEVAGLPEDAFLPLPMLFEPDGDHRGAPAIALVPNPVNFALVNPVVGSRPTVVVADPHFRAEGQLQLSDPMLAAWADLLAPYADLVAVEAWSSYHLLNGHVHCATATRRTGR